jgi:aspartate-semialdehyde dehydrogenase
MLVTNPNCSTIVLTLALAPLAKFGIERVMAATMQAVSGAGYPGVASMDILANVIPFIGSEEEKMQQETQKILGGVADGQARPLAARVSAHCNRVAVTDGHLVAVSLELSAKPKTADVQDAIEHFRSVPQTRKLPSAPPRPLIYMPQQDRPQPRRDASRENGMCVFVGRLRECPVLDVKFVACGHNTIRGAAGAAVLNAELMASEGFLD